MGTILRKGVLKMLLRPKGTEGGGPVMVVGTRSEANMEPHLKVGSAIICYSPIHICFTGNFIRNGWGEVGWDDLVLYKPIR